MNIILKKPQEDDLSYLKILWNDYDEMTEIGGSFTISDEHLTDWYKTIVEDGSDMGYFFIIKENNPIGEISFREIESKYYLSYRIETRYREDNVLKQSVIELLNIFKNLKLSDSIICQIPFGRETHKKLFEEMGFEQFNDEDEPLTFNLKYSLK